MCVKYLRFFILPFILSALLLTGCSSKEKPPEFISVLKEKIPDLMEKARVPGLSIAVIRDGKIAWTGAFGVRSTESGEKVDENTMFEAASLSKPVTAYTVLRLVEQGIMTLDTPLCEYYPYDFLAEDDRYKQLTARIVMTHTTGLPNWGSRFIRNPGEKFGYSGEGFLYLGRTAEKLTGLSLQELAKREVFDPLGMEHTSYVWNEAYDRNGACGHGRDAKPNEKRKQTEPNGGASLLSTARDYATFVAAILNAKGLSKGTIAQMISPHVKADDRGPKETHDKLFWGWGWGIMPSESENAFWHWGNNGDLRGYVVAYPERKEGIVFFANSENLFVMAEAIIEEVIEEKQWPFDWMEVLRLDDPAWSVRTDIEDAFLKDNAEAGMKLFASVRESQPELLNERAIFEMVGLISQNGKKEEAAGLLRLMLEDSPKSLNARFFLGIISFEMGDYAAGLKEMDTCLEISPGFKRAQFGRDWILAAAEARKNPVKVPMEMLEKYAGDYGPRHIYLHEGNLFYQRDGRDAYKLIPLKPDYFSLEGYTSFRIQFVSDENGNVKKIVGHYQEGNTDQSPRDDK